MHLTRRKRTQVDDPFAGLGGSLRRTVGSLNCAAPSPVRHRTVRPVLTKHSLVKYTRAKAKGATTFYLPLLRQLTTTRRAVHPRRPGILVLTPAHRLTTRVNSGLRTCTGCRQAADLIIFNKIGVGPRVSTLGHKITVLITAPNHLLSLYGRNTISLGNVRTMILSRTSEVLSVKFLPSVGGILAHLPAQHRSLFFSTALSPRVAALTGDFVGAAPIVIHVSPKGPTMRHVSRAICFIRGRAGCGLLG